MEVAEFSRLETSKTGLHAASGFLYIYIDRSYYLCIELKDMEDNT